jgi:hypothetical protein
LLGTRNRTARDSSRFAATSGRKLRTELAAAEWDHQAEEALTILRALHVNKRSFDGFERLARDMGSRH